MATLYIVDKVVDANLVNKGIGITRLPSIRYP